MAERVGSKDWARTPLGPMDQWPRSLRSLVETILAHPLPMAVLWGPELIQIYNDGYARIAGSKHPALGGPARECWPEAWPVNAPIFERVLKRGEPVALEDTLFPLARNGSGVEDVYVNISYGPAHDDAGRIAGVFVTVAETTAKVPAEKTPDRPSAQVDSERARLAEAALRESEAQLGAILDNVPAMIYVVDAENRFRFISRQWEAVFGLVNDQVAGHSLYEFFSKEEADQFASNNRKVLDSRTPVETEEVVEHPDGTHTYISIKVPLFGADGVPDAICGISTDITERKRDEELLAAQNRILELVTGPAPLAEVLTHLARVVEQQSGGSTVAAIMLVDEDGARLRSSAGPSLPRSYLDAIDGIRISDGVGTCVDAAARNEVVVTPDIATAESWRGLSHLPLALGLKSAWSMAVRGSDGRVLGTFGTYFRECREPTRRERQVVEVLCRTAALAIERRRAEAALAENESRYRTLFDSMDEGFLLAEIVFDEQERPVDILYLEANPAATRMIGQDVAGRHLREVNPGYETHWFETFGTVARTGQSRRKELYAEQLKAWFDFYVFRVGGTESRRVAVVFKDVTQRKEAEERQRRNHDTFFNLIQNNPFGVYVVDADFKLAQVSLGSQKVFSNVRPLLGRDFAEVLRTVWAEPFASEAIGRFRHTLDTGEPYSSPSTLERRQDISEVEAYDWRIERIVLPDGRFGVVCYFYDLSERQRWETALRESESRLADQKQAFELALSGAPIQDVLDVLVQAGQRPFGPDSRTAIFIVDSDSAHLRFVAGAGLSDSYTRAMDGLEIGPNTPSCGLAAFTGRAVIVRDVATDPLWAPYVQLAQEHGIRACWSFPIHSPGGEVTGTFAVYHQSPRQPESHDLEKVMLLAQAASLVIERYKAEDALRHAKSQAERASDAKSDFLATLSHELRTPLTPVLLTASLMGSHPALPEELRDDVETIRRNVELESQLISDLLDLTRIERGKLQLDLQDVDLHLIIRSAVDICRREASAKLVLELSARHHTVRGDSTRLQQIFWNLVSNAVKFTGPDGTITVLTSDAPDGRIRVEVTDTGIGIDPAVLPRLFDAFEQGEVRAARQQAGLGLGLAISKRLAEAHGGTVVASSPGRGRGATFAVELPTVDVLPPVPTTDRMTPKSSAERTLDVLVVEDNEPTLTVMSKLLRRLGHRVTGATSVASAAAAARGSRFDLIISDLGLPDGSGLDLMRQVRRHYKGRAIALTGYGMESDVTASREAGFALHLTKPVDLQKLESGIAEVMARRRELNRDLA